MNDSKIAFRAKEQLGKFLGKVLTHFSKPRKKFLADMLYGIQACGDAQLSSIIRAINDDSIILVDPTEIRKEFGLKMEHVSLGCPAYFASVWLGRYVKREVLAEHLKTLSQRHVSAVKKWVNSSKPMLAKQPMRSSHHGRRAIGAKGRRERRQGPSFRTRVVARQPETR